MNKQELIKKYETEWKEHSPFNETASYALMVKSFLDQLKKMDGPQKVTIPQFVADWIEESKNWKSTLYYALDHSPEKVNLWLNENEANRQNTFARAWLDGYEVEQEKRYLVKIEGLEIDEAYLKFQLDDKYWYMGIVGDYKHAKTKHTRKELEDAGFGWVFDCPGIEIEEVEG